MNKIKFNTKQEYINYVKEHFKYQYIRLEDGLLIRNSLGDQKYISSEPKSYPCILIWNEDDLGYFTGIFVYTNDF